MNRLSTILTAAIVSFGVATVASPASRTPVRPTGTHGISTAVTSVLPASSGPSLADQVAALTKRVDRVQQREAQDRSNINQVALATQDATDVTGCINSALFIVVGADNTVTEADPGDPDGNYVPTLDESCIDDGSAGS